MDTPLPQLPTRTPVIARAIKLPAAGLVCPDCGRQMVVADPRALAELGKRGGEIPVVCPCGAQLAVSYSRVLVACGK